MSELNPVRIAVIGAGAMGRNHIRFVTEEPEAELVAIADAFEGARLRAQRSWSPKQVVPWRFMAEHLPAQNVVKSLAIRHRLQLTVP